MGVLILAGMPAGTPLSGVFAVGTARANEDPAAFDRSYKESGKLAAQLAQRYEGALRQTALRLGEVARQDAGALARNPVAIETSRSPWPIVTYVLNGDRLSLIPEGKAHLSPEDLQGVSGRQPHVFLKGSTVLVTVLAGSNRYTTAEIPLEAFTGPLSSISLGGNSALMLLDDQGRSLGAKPLGSEDQELLKSVSAEAATTLVSKTSVLSLARIPSAGWTVIVRLPLAEAYRGIAMPELDERTLPNPLYLVKRTQGASLEGVGQGILFSFGGLALLVVALLLLRRRLRDPRLKSIRMPFAEQGPFSAPLSAAQTGGLAVLEALVGEKAGAVPDERLSTERQPTERRIEHRALLPAPAQPSPEGAASSVWRDTLQAEVSYLQAELRKTQEQLKQLVQQPQLGTLQSRMESELKEAERRLSAQQEAELREFSEALRQRLDLEARRLEALEQNSRQVLDGLDRKVAQQEGQFLSSVETLQSKYDGLSDGLRQRFEQDDQRLTALNTKYDGLSDGLRQRFEQDDQRLAALNTKFDGLSDGLRQRFEQDDQRLAALHTKFDGLSEGLRQRFEQEDQLLASLDQEVDRTRSEIEALRAQQAGFGELSESKFGLLESELESYRNQGQQADRQANERIEVLAKAFQELHSALGQVQSSNGKLRQEVQAALAQAHQENAMLHEELGTLSARVHRVVQLLAKGRPA